MIERSIIGTFEDQLSEWLRLNPPSDSLRMVSEHRVVLGTGKNEREENQDRVIYVEFQTKSLNRKFLLAAIFDGMGGMIDGGKCADIAIVTLVSNLLRLPRARGRIALIEALNFANLTLWEKYKGQGGTTFAGLFFENDRQIAVNIGDSRIYSFDSIGGLRRHSVDDNIGNQLAKLKGLNQMEISPEIAGRLGQYLGMRGLPKPNIFSIQRPKSAVEDRTFLLSTDGVHLISDQRIERILRSNESLSCAASQLLEAGRAVSSDNGTVALLKSPTLPPFTNQNFDCLRLWTNEGCFSFSFPTSYVSDQPVSTAHLQNELSASSANPEEKPAARIKKNENERKEESRRRKKQEKPRKEKPQVRIEQLDFDPIPDDESPQ